MTHAISPTQRAEALRLKAAGLTGDERDYCLWLAREWDKTALRYAPSDRPARRVQVSAAGERLADEDLADPA